MLDSRRAPLHEQKDKKKKQKKGKGISRSRSRSSDRRRKKRRSDASEISRQRSGDHHLGEAHREAKAEDYPEQTSPMNESFGAGDDATLTKNPAALYRAGVLMALGCEKSVQLLFTELSP